jgi:low affinity Fe/Cu permease
MPDVEERVTRQRSAYAEATRTPPFAYVYWGATVVEVALAVWSWVWAAADQRSVASWVILVAVVVQGFVAQRLAGRIERRRAEARGDGPRLPGRE